MSFIEVFVAFQTATIAVLLWNLYKRDSVQQEVLNQLPITLGEMYMNFNNVQEVFNIVGEDVAEIIDVLVEKNIMTEEQGRRIKGDDDA